MAPIDRPPFASTEMDLCMSLLLLRQDTRTDSWEAPALPSSSCPQQRPPPHQPLPPFAQSHPSKPSAAQHTPHSSRITYQDLHRCFHMPLAEVGQHLGVCTTLLKKICRKLGIKRWPHRQIRKIDNCISSLRGAMSRNVGGDHERALFLEQIAALDNVRRAVLDNPNGTHTLEPPVRTNFTKRKRGRNESVKPPKQMGSILNKFYASHAKKNREGTGSPPTEDEDEVADSVDMVPVLPTMLNEEAPDEKTAMLAMPVGGTSVGQEPTESTMATSDLQSRLLAIQKAKSVLLGQHQLEESRAFQLLQAARLQNQSQPSGGMKALSQVQPQVVLRPNSLFSPHASHTGDLAGSNLMESLHRLAAQTKGHKPLDSSLSSILHPGTVHPR